MFNKKYKISSLPRSTMFIAICLILAIIISFMISELTSVKGMSKIEYRNIVVEEGDTLWSIAEASCEENPNTDVRDIIYYITVINKTSASQLKPGDILQVPIEI